MNSVSVPRNSVMFSRFGNSVQGRIVHLFNLTLDNQSCNNKQSKLIKSDGHATPLNSLIIWFIRYIDPNGRTNFQLSHLNFF